MTLKSAPRVRAENLEFPNDVTVLVPFCHSLPHAKSDAIQNGKDVRRIVDLKSQHLKIVCNMNNFPKSDSEDKKEEHFVTIESMLRCS